MNKLYFIYNNNKELLIKMKDENILIPSEDNINNLNISLNNLELLTSKDNREFLFGETHDVSAISSPYQFFKLQSLLGLVNDSIYMRV